MSKFSRKDVTVIYTGEGSLIKCKAIHNPSELYKIDYGVTKEIAKENAYEALEKLWFKKIYTPELPLGTKNKKLDIKCDCGAKFFGSPKHKEDCPAYEEF